MGAAAVVQQVTWEEALRAGRVLFGTRADALLAGAGWRDELKRAYKRRVLETHPDRARTLGRAETELAREFQAVADAYRLLQEVPDLHRWIRARPAPAARRPAPAPAPGPAPAARRDAEARRAERVRKAEEARRTAEEVRARTAGRRAEQAKREAQAQAQARREEEERRAAETGRAERGSRRAEAASARRAATAPDWRHVVKPRPLPRRRIRLAEYLYYSGRISWAEMVEALTWQRRQRPAVGRIAVEFGFLTPLEVAEVIERRWRAGEACVPFGEFALRIGMITPFERLAMIGRQVRLQRPIGQFFVERGLVGEHEFDDLRRQIVRHNLRHYV
ncbi:MAG TPA: J domain-containing protein [Anaeromyxobacteraceae bacterium]|nr:J domain-containing protein [Anaeromyxobacteraceae bacterium]